MCASFDSPLFEHRQTQAASILGVAPCTLKQVCNELGIGRWPWRKLRTGKDTRWKSRTGQDTRWKRQNALHRGPLWRRPEVSSMKRLMHFDDATLDPLNAT